MWLINEAGYALQTLGRHDEAVALMKRLIALDMDEHPELIGPSINLSSMLWEAGRHAEALEHAVCCSAIFPVTRTNMERCGWHRARPAPSPALAGWRKAGRRPGG